jgi:hypothetical protein
LERGEALRGGHQLDRVHVDVLRHRGRPVDRLGDVVCGHRLHARVDAVRLRLVAAEPHQRELRVRHAGLDAGDPHPGAVQVAAEVEAELVDERLRPAVEVAAGVGVAARHRAEVDHVAALALHHAGQDRAAAVDQALAVRVDHLVPVVQVGVLGRAQAKREARVVHEHVDGLEVRRQPGDGRGDGRAVPDVELQRQDPVAQPR